MKTLDERRQAWIDRSTCVLAFFFALGTMAREYPRYWLNLYQHERRRVMFKRNIGAGFTPAAIFARWAELYTLAPETDLYISLQQEIEGFASDVQLGWLEVLK